MFLFVKPSLHDHTLFINGVTIRLISNKCVNSTHNQSHTLSGLCLGFIPCTGTGTRWTKLKPVYKGNLISITVSIPVLALADAYLLGLSCMMES